MPRIARLHHAGTVRHVISRYINNEWRCDDEARKFYLSRYGRALKRTDWGGLAYALMSSHQHNANHSGRRPLAALYHPLNTAMGRWHNEREGRTGPVFAGRPRERIVEPDAIARVIAYIHNNPVRANVVADPSDSAWTSHRAYIGEVEAPPWLRVLETLDLCGFEPTKAGRIAFHEYVVARRHDPRDEMIDGDIGRTRTRMRRLVGAVVELKGPAIRGDMGADQEIIAPEGAQLHVRWNGDLRLPLELVAVAEDVTSRQMASSSRQRCICRARRLFYLVAHRFLHRPLTEVAARVGRSVSAASKALRERIPAMNEMVPIAEIIARQVWELTLDDD